MNPTVIAPISRWIEWLTQPMGVSTVSIFTEKGGRIEE